MYNEKRVSLILIMKKKAAFVLDLDLSCALAVHLHPPISSRKWTVTKYLYNLLGNYETKNATVAELKC